MKEHVAILTIRSNSSRGTWPRGHCGLSIDRTVDCRAYSRIKKILTLILLGYSEILASNESMVAGLHE